MKRHPDPTSDVLLTVIAFDVSNDRRRRQLTRVLQASGERVLESVFEVWLTAAQLQRLERRAVACIHPVQDRLAFYTLAPSDAQDRIVWGQGQPTHDWHFQIV